MKTFQVECVESRSFYFTIEADDEEEARNLALELDTSESEGDQRESWDVIEVYQTSQD